MKYRYITQVMTRHSGMMSIFCRGLDQAQNNMEEYLKRHAKGEDTISFDSVSGMSNVMLMSEIIAVHVTDSEIQRDIALEEAKEHQELHREIDLGVPPNDDEDYR